MGPVNACKQLLAPLRKRKALSLTGCFLIALLLLLQSCGWDISVEKTLHQSFRDLNAFQNFTLAQRRSFEVEYTPPVDYSRHKQKGIQLHEDAGQNPCGLDVLTLGKLLDRPHDSSHEGASKTEWESTQRRWGYQGRWLLFQEFWEMVKASEEELVCAVLSVSRAVPCPDSEECLLGIHVRPETDNILIAFMIFERNEYGFLAEYQGLETILDAGGNAGYASLIFGTMFPKARVITLEPNSLNFRTTQHNVGHLPNVTPLHLALWDHPSLLSIGPSSRGATSASLQVQEIDVGNVDNVEQGNILSGVSVGFLLDAFYLPSFDYVKIDIEGSEKEVFERSAINELEWLPTTKLITVEVHEDVRPGAAGSVDLALSSDGLFLKHEVGEYQVWENTMMVGSIKSSNISKGG